MRPSITLRSVMIGALLGMCVLVLGPLRAVAVDQTVTWLLGIELLGPGLITGLAIALFLLHKSHYPWRYKP